MGGKQQIESITLAQICRGMLAPDCLPIGRQSAAIVFVFKIGVKGEQSGASTDNLAFS